ncbi:MAG TPA: potassium/proton antiporter [Bacteroidota bacterium]|nr:potassium/proton antiporter [Bacteroidota bacterium]
MIGIEYILLVVSALILASVAIARATHNLGVPTLLLFLGVGMLAGSEGPGGIQFNDAALAQSVGVVALVLILFSGGLDTNWKDVRPVTGQAVRLATIGVVLTAAAVGVFVTLVLDFSVLEGLLIGAVISSTDAAAVFSVLRSKNVHLRHPLKPLLELESGSNDPMAVFLTVGMIGLMTGSISSELGLALFFVLQMGIGFTLGYLFGKLLVWTINRLKFSYEGIYSVFTLAFTAFIYSITTLINGSGFLAVYVAGIILGNSNVVQKKSLLRFFDGLAWLSQIGMFVTLGLLVNPSEIMAILVPGILISVFLMFVARPASVFLSLLPKEYTWREKLFISWVGLRGAAPIILATFPLLANVGNAGIIFNTVFFIVLTSALLQGWSIPSVARLLHVDAPPLRQPRYPIEPVPVAGGDTELVDLTVPHGSAVAGKTIIELGLPQQSLIALVGRGEEFIVPSGSTVLEEGDTLLVLVKQKDLPDVRRILLEKASENDR